LQAGRQGNVLSFSTTIIGAVASNLTNGENETSANERNRNNINCNGCRRGKEGKHEMEGSLPISGSRSLSVTAIDVVEDLPGLLAAQAENATS
jgi:hypothetical protein